MGYAERNVWSGLGASLLGVAVYAAIVAPQLGRAPVEAIGWQWPMVACVGGALILAILVSIVWGILAGLRDPETEHRADVRDRDIERMGDRVGRAFTVLGALTALVLAMVDAPAFWIGHAIFLGFFLASSLGSIAQLVAYRRGLL
ncbi:hypothetical protein [Microbacterium sp. TNHR37B]|uniref:hypothetical protein n=1 Tax=Microbacterium sp. TNHR37B TaxID=1775956 RepID=UPI0007B240CA|nr:hypothetical protein [Microbacterium sp. TNHR37B]KZE88507.1 hypothetical protein AVP41_03011 [Microbacterium sp. TNHR37B]